MAGEVYGQGFGPLLVSFPSVVSRMGRGAESEALGLLPVRDLL